MADRRPTDGDLALPVGTVTLLLADVEGSTRLWESEPAAMTEAIAQLDEVVADIIGRHEGVRPVEQGEGDSFVAGFARASDAVAAALDLQLADTAPIRLRIGIHTGEVQLRDEGNYVGSAINRAARLRNLGHGGQTLLSNATADLVVDRLPPAAHLADLGRHRLRDLARPEHVLQLCHPDLPADFPALRSLDSYAHNLPVQLTSFIGREAELEDVRELLGHARLVTLVGSGGAGKTRLALHVAADVLSDFPDGAFLVELAPLADGDGVALAIARALGMNDDRTRSTIETIVHHVNDRRVLVVLDNCEQVIAACAPLVETLLRGCGGLVVLATSREPMGAAGEVAYRVPSLSLPTETGSIPVAALNTSEAVQLFCERGARARAGFVLTESNASAVGDICRRLDGIPLALELAAARVRVFSPDQLAHALGDRFRLLTGGIRTALPRQQTLRASVDWSHHLLTEPEQILFRRLGAFAGAFEFAAAEAVGAGDGLDAHQVLDQVVSLVDKSLVMMIEAPVGTRYRLLETVRHYAMERLTESGEAEAVRHRHSDHYLAMAAQISVDWASVKQDAALDQAEDNIADLRAAFSWAMDAGNVDAAMYLASSLVGYWNGRGRMVEGLGWLDVALSAGDDASPAARATALAVSAILGGGYLNSPQARSRADESLAIARQLEGGSSLLGLALTAAANAYLFVAPRQAVSYYAEGAELARARGNAFSLAVMRHGVGIAHVAGGDPKTARAILREADGLARQAPSPFHIRQNAALDAWAAVMVGDLTEASALGEAATEMPAGEPARAFMTFVGAWAAALRGDFAAARRGAEETVALADDLGLRPGLGIGLFASGVADVSAGDAVSACRSFERAWPYLVDARGVGDMLLGSWIEAELAAGAVDSARGRADDAIARARESELGWQLGAALAGRARVAVVDGQVERAEDLAHEALTIRLTVGDRVGIADTLELLAAMAAGQESADEAVRLMAASEGIRGTIGYQRFGIYRDWYESTIAGLRNATSSDEFDRAWAEGSSLSIEDAVAYSQRGRGERKRPSSGWASLTPAELEVIRLVGDGLANKEIAERLFVSPRTVQAHLTHIYNKVDVRSRVQLAKEALARR